MSIEKYQKILQEFINSPDFPRIVGRNTVLKKSGIGELWIELLNNGDYKILGENDFPLDEEKSVFLPIPALLDSFDESEYLSYIRECKEWLENALLEHFDDWYIYIGE